VSSERDLLERVRQQLRDHRYDSIYKGAKIFVWPEQNMTVLDALEEHLIHLKPSHVIISESLLPDKTIYIEGKP
jgi:hypothetical protein